MFKPTQAHKEYKIALKTAKGNTVAFINLSSQFTKAVLSKAPESLSIEEVLSIGGGIEEYLLSLEIVVEAVENPTKSTIEDY